MTESVFFSLETLHPFHVSQVNVGGVREEEGGRDFGHSPDGRKGSPSQTSVGSIR